MAWEAHHGRADAVVALQPTSPFRTGAQIDDAVALFESSGADTVTAVRPVTDHPWWTWVAAGNHIEPLYPDRMSAERGALAPIMVETGVIYVVRRDLILSGRIHGRRVVPYPTDATTSVDIDTAEDLAWAEFLLARRGLPGAS
jgi:CMP-N-acetylneuraminic acid synthetase